MTTFTKSFYVTEYREPTDWSSRYGSVFKSLEAATDKARTNAWSSAEDQGVYEMVAVVSKPELVNTATVTPVN